MAQIARRLAERLNRDQRELAERAGGIDPEIAEAAALAHDLGHPPFGHLAEEELNELAREADGFEGNAQSFRIVTRLVAHRDNYEGLDLTRATLNALLKYPWFRDMGPPDKRKKWGAYSTESREFEFAREGHQGSLEPSIEAQIMDHADAVAYSVHDLEDFYRAGLIPLELLPDAFAEHLEDFQKNTKLDPAPVRRHAETLERLVKVLPFRQRYTGTHRERGVLRATTSYLINDFLSPVRLTESEAGVRLEVPELVQVTMGFLQRLLWRYVINNPRLASQQRGQREIVRYLFAVFHDAADSEKERALIPPLFDRQVKAIDAPPPGETLPRAARVARLAADVVASLTDSQAVRLYRRLRGTDPGFVTELPVGQ